MPKRNGSVSGVLVLGCSALAGGCVDAVSQGAASGLYDAMAAIVEVAITDAVSALTNNEN